MVYPQTTDIYFQLERDTFLLVVPLWKDRILLESPDRVVLFEWNICQPWQMRMEELFFGEEVSILLEELLPSISIESGLLSDQLVREYLAFSFFVLI